MMDRISKGVNEIGLQRYVSASPSGRRAALATGDRYERETSFSGPDGFADCRAVVMIVLMTPTPTPRPVIVLSLEGFARASLGCYGCSWNRTPAIDTIAAGGCVWDRMIAESDDSADVLRQWFQSDWAQRWRRFGPVDLVTDATSVSRIDVDCFDHVVRLPLEPVPTEPAEDIVVTQFGRLIAAAVEREQQNPDASVLWIHSDFLTRCWDAPRDLYPVTQLEDDEFANNGPEDSLDQHQAAAEPPPIDLLFDCTEPPQLACTDHDHPDWISSWMRTYACQVRLVDVLIEVLLGSLEKEDPCFVLAGSSGFRLGQGGWIGSGVGPLRSADIHLPLVVSDIGPLRLPALSPARDLATVLARLADNEPPVSPDQWNREADSSMQIETHSTKANRVVTTSEWFYVEQLDQSEHLFLKPDDVEDFNDVARVRKEVTQNFRK